MLTEVAGSTGHASKADKLLWGIQHFLLMLVINLSDPENHTWCLMGHDHSWQSSGEMSVSGEPLMQWTSHYT